MKRKAELQTESTGSRARVILNIIAAIISLSGLAIAIYLLVMGMTSATAACDGSAACIKVLGSSYAKIAGIPVAFLGAWGYFAAFGFAIFAAFGYKRAPGLLAMTVGPMFAITVWLLYVQAFVLHAFCRYCLFSAAFTFLLAGLVVAGWPARSDESME